MMNVSFHRDFVCNYHFPELAWYEMGLCKRNWPIYNPQSWVTTAVIKNAQNIP
jgi:hypothetical protein